MRMKKTKLIKGGLVFGGDCKDCKLRTKLFSPVGRGTKNWTMLDKALLRDYFQTCEKCWQKYVHDKKFILGKLDELKRDYLNKERG